MQGISQFRGNPPGAGLFAFAGSIGRKPRIVKEGIALPCISLLNSYHMSNPLSFPPPGLRRPDGSPITPEEEVVMSTNVARVTHIIAESPTSFDDAIKVGFDRAVKTLRGITGLRIVEMRVSVKDNKIYTYRVKMEVIFILD
jgi:dodecin